MKLDPTKEAIATRNPAAIKCAVAFSHIVAALGDCETEQDLEDVARFLAPGSEDGLSPLETAVVMQAVGYVRSVATLLTAPDDGAEKDEAA